LQQNLLEVSVNGQPMPEPAVVLKGPDGALYVAAESLRAWRLQTDGLPVREVAGKSYVSLAQVPGLTFEFSEENQTLALTAAPERFAGAVLSALPGDSGPIDDSGWGGFVNYDVLAESAGGDVRLAGALELGAFSPHGVGLSTFLGRWSDEGFGVTRLETSWTVDDVAGMRSLRIGDSVTRGGVGGAPLRFGGVQFARNFAVQPGFITLPLPSLSGSAALPSVVDVYVNDVLQSRNQVRPGPFQLRDVPIVTGSGEVRLVVTDLLGRETVTRQSYYAAPELLRRGLHDYSYELGFLREEFGRRSNRYTTLFAAGTHRYGLTDRLTGEAHVAVSDKVQAGGVAAAYLWPDIGLFTVGAALSQSGRGTGSLVNLGFERRSQSFSLGAAAEFASEDFTTLGEVPGRDPPAATFQAFAGIPLGFGSLGASYVLRDERGQPDVEILGVNASVRLGRIGALNIAAQHGFGAEAGTAVQLFLTVPLGARSFASGGFDYRDDAATFTANFQRSPPVGEGIGYALAGAVGDYKRIEGRLAVQTSFGDLDAILTWTDGKTGVRFTASGAVATVGGNVFASRRLNQSFAAVKVGNFENVRVYADNQLVGRTNRDGVAIIPRLRPYERNRVRIDYGDLPFDAEVADPERDVRPRNRSGVAIDFAARRSRAAIVNVRLENGTPLPPGSVVALEGGVEEFVSAPGGDVYLSGLDRTNQVVARFEGTACRFTVDLPDGDDPQPRLGPLICRPSQS